MEKINFEAGTQVSPAKVTIDNVDHEVTPAVWEGNTPLSPFVLNKMQSNIENAISESGVIVSAVEPTGANREKIWLQKGENLFNYETSNYLLAYSQITEMKIVASTSSDNHRSSYIKCKPNTTYTIKKKAGHSFRVSTTTNVPAIGVTLNKTMADHTATTITITTGENDNYIFFTCYSSVNGDTGNYIDMYKTVIIEEGTNIISDKMYVLNDNNVYEEFMPKEKIEKVTQNLTLNTTYAKGGTVNYIKSNNIVQAYMRLDLEAVSKPASYINIASGLLFKPLTELRIYANLLNNIEVLSSNEALVQIKTNGDIYLKTTASYANNSLVIITFTYITGD